MNAPEKEPPEIIDLARTKGTLGSIKLAPGLTIQGDIGVGTVITNNQNSWMQIAPNTLYKSANFSSLPSLEEAMKDTLTSADATTQQHLEDAVQQITQELEKADGPDEALLGFLFRFIQRRNPAVLQLLVTRIENGQIKASTSVLDLARQTLSM